MTSTVLYSGQLRTVATHIASSSVVETDAPIDNHGQGARFSPTDLVATAVASCMATVMGIKANEHGWNIEGALFEVTKVMSASPRRIAEVVVKVTMPASQQYEDKVKAILERTAFTCPVLLSLHPELKKSITFYWP